MLGGGVQRAEEVGSAGALLVRPRQAVEDLADSAAVEERAEQSAGPRSEEGPAVRLGPREPRPVALVAVGARKHDREVPRHVQGDRRRSAPHVVQRPGKQASTSSVGRASPRAPRRVDPRYNVSPPKSSGVPASLRSATHFAAVARAEEDAGPPRLGP